MHCFGVSHQELSILESDVKVPVTPGDQGAREQGHPLGGGGGAHRDRSSRPAHSFVKIWLWKYFYSYSSSSADSRRAVVF